MTAIEDYSNACLMKQRSLQYVLCMEKSKNLPEIFMQFDYIDMPIDRYDYKNLTDYLQHLYQCQPFARHGVEHPVTVFYPSDEQIRNVDSVLDPYLPGEEKRDFAFYDYSYLHDLQNSKPGLFDGHTYTLKRLRQNPLKLRGSIGRYYDMLATCATLEHELQAAVEEGWMRAASRTTYHRQVDAQDALTRGLKRSAAIGIGTLTVFNDGGRYKAMLARRSEKTAFDSGMFHVLPAMMFNPTTSDFCNPQEWSIRHQVLREALEEMFNMPEETAPERWDYFYRHPALLYLQSLMDAGKAQLYLTGVIINLLTLRPEISTLLLIRDPAWYARITAPDSEMPFATADETVSDSVVTAPIDDDENVFGAIPRPTIFANACTSGCHAVVGY